MLFLFLLCAEWQGLAEWRVLAERRVRQGNKLEPSLYQEQNKDKCLSFPWQVRVLGVGGPLLIYPLSVYRFRYVGDGYPVAYKVHAPSLSLYGGVLLSAGAGANTPIQ